MLQLPNDILLDILEYLLHFDLLALRLTCKRLANLCQSLVFKHVLLTHGEGGIKALLAMTTSTKICRSVQRITYDFDDFGIPRYTDEYSELLGIKEAGVTVTNPRLHDKYYSEYRGLGEKDIDVRRLAAALPHFHRLRSILLIRDLESRGLGGSRDILYILSSRATIFPSSHNYISCIGAENRRVSNWIFFRPSISGEGRDEDSPAGSGRRGSTRGVRWTLTEQRCGPTEGWEQQSCCTTCGARTVRPYLQVMLYGGRGTCVV
jgi:hypothetical protein